MRPSALAFAVAVFGWVAEDGLHEFTDDSRRIPARYIAVADDVETDLYEYRGLTITEPEADAVNARLRERLNRLRQMNAVDVHEEEVPQPLPPTIILHRRLESEYHPHRRFHQ